MVKRCAGLSSNGVKTFKTVHLCWHISTAQSRWRELLISRCNNSWPHRVRRNFSSQQSTRNSGSARNLQPFGCRWPLLKTLMCRAYWSARSVFSTYLSEVLKWKLKLNRRLVPPWWVVYQRTRICEVLTECVVVVALVTFRLSKSVLRCSPFQDAKAIPMASGCGSILSAPIVLLSESVECTDSIPAKVCWGGNHIGDIWLSLKLGLEDWKLIHLSSLSLLTMRILFFEFLQNDIDSMFQVSSRTCGSYNGTYFLSPVAVCKSHSVLFF